MRTNATCKIAILDNTELHPSYRPTGCYFHVTNFQQSDTFSVTDPVLGVSIAKCNQFTTAVKFAELIHTLLLETGNFQKYADADSAEGRTNVLSESGLRNFYHLRLCKPGQFDSALAEQRERNLQLASELNA